MIDNEIIELVEKTLDLVTFHKDRITDLISQNQRGYALDEFKTISIKAPRGLGHTTAAAQLVMQYPKSMIITPDNRMEKYVIKNYGLESFKHVYDFNRVEISNLGFGDYDLLIFDPWTTFIHNTMNMKERVRHYMERHINDAKLFVLLG